MSRKSTIIDLLRSKQEEEPVEFVFNDNYTAIEQPFTFVIDENESWVLPMLFKQVSTGSVHTWQIGYNAVSKKLLWVVGNVDTGSQQVSTGDVIPTRAQKGSYQKKALQEATTKYDLKIKEGFHTEVEGKSSLLIPLPMLANLYKPPTDVSEGNIQHFPVAAQAKLDGERHIVFATDDGERIVQYSRRMNEREHFDHIRQESGRLLEFLPPGTILDGELYSPDVDFQMITSIAGSKKEKHKSEKELEYFIFDVYHPDTVWKPELKKLSITDNSAGDDGFVYARASGYTVENYNLEAKEYVELPAETPDAVCLSYGDILENSPMWVVEVRISLLMNAFNCYRVKYGKSPEWLRLVKTYIINQRQDIMKLFNQMLKMKIGKHKLEGLMIRHMSRGDANPLASLYRPGRSDALLKIKAFKSTEVLITGVKSGKNRAKDLAVLVYKEPGTSVVGTVVPSFSHEARREMLLHPEKVIGRMMLVTFQNRMKSGALRFPTGEAFV